MDSLKSQVEELTQNKKIKSIEHTAQTITVLTEPLYLNHYENPTKTLLGQIRLEFNIHRNSFYLTKLENLTNIKIRRRVAGQEYVARKGEKDKLSVRVRHPHFYSFLKDDFVCSEDILQHPHACFAGYTRPLDTCVKTGDLVGYMHGIIQFLENYDPRAATTYKFNALEYFNTQEVISIEQKTTGRTKRTASQEELTAGL